MSEWKLNEIVAEQLALVEQEATLREQIDTLRDAIAEVARERRRLSAASDKDTSEPLREAYRDAEALLALRASDRARLAADLETLEERLGNGDDAVTEEELTTASSRLRRADLLLPPAKVSLAVAEGALRPFLADNHLAALAADALETITDVPVFIQKAHDTVPEVAAAVILSQMTPTKDYGTVDAAGEVRFIVRGNAAVDLDRWQQFMVDQGSDVRVRQGVIEFTRAAWPVPRLARPSGEAVARFASLFGEAWASRIEDSGVAGVLAEAGYKVQTTRTGLTALNTCIDTSLTVEDRRATGVATLLLSAERPYGRFTVEDIEVEVRELTDSLRAELVGVVTEAGEVVDLTVACIGKGDGSIWDRGARVGVTGHLTYLPTIEVALQLDYTFEPVSVVVAD